MAESKRLRLGLLGAGRRAQAHLTTIAGLADRYEFVAVYDLAEGNAHAVAAPFGIKAYSDINEFFSRERLDVVDIVTPSECHHLMAKVAADHGVHMLIETPLAPTRAMMNFIAEVADKAGVRVEVAENAWRQPLQRLNRKAMDAGLIGGLLRVSNFYEIGGYHAMAALRYCAGAEVDEVRGIAHRFEVERSVETPDVPGMTSDTESWTQALLFFANGAIGSYVQISTWTSPLRRGHPRFITVEGTRGLIASGRSGVNALYRLENGVQAAYPLKIDTRQEGERKIPTRFYYETSPRVEYANPFADLPLKYADNWYRLGDDIARADELTSIHRAVVNKESPEYGIANARRDQELCIAIMESTRLDGQSVRLPLSGETVWEREQHETFRATWGGDPLKDADQLITRNFLRTGLRRQRAYDFVV